MADRGNSARSILLSLGMGDFNATMVIPYLFMAPAQTDPQMAQVILLTKHLQGLLKSMGCPLPITGSIDSNWAPYLAKAVGRDWLNTPWADICRDALAAKARGFSFARNGTPIMPMGQPLGSIGSQLESIPWWAFAIGGYFLHRYLKRA